MECFQTKPSSISVEARTRPTSHTYLEVCETYKSYILSQYNSGVTVVFNGHAGPISTKSAEQNAEQRDALLQISSWHYLVCQQRHLRVSSFGMVVTRCV